MSRLPIAVVGTGYLGRIHARLAAGLPELALAAVVDLDAAAREEVAAAHGALPLADHRELAGRVAAAVVAVPTKFHHRVARDLIERGIHVLVEKPFTTTLAEADDLIDGAARRGLVLQVGHVERFNPIWRRMRPSLSRPRFIDAVRRGPFSFRSTDVSVIYDLMIHDVDLALSLVDSPVARIDASGAAVVTRHPDWAEARIAFANGAVANIFVSRVSDQAERRMRVHGDDGCVTLDFGTRTAIDLGVSPRVKHRQFDVDRLSAEERARFKEYLFTDLLPLTQVPAVDGNAIADELVAFAAAIRTGTTAIVDGHQGRAALEVCEAIEAAILRRLPGARPVAA